MLVWVDKDNPDNLLEWSAQSADTLCKLWYSDIKHHGFVLREDAKKIKTVLLKYDVAHAWWVDDGEGFTVTLNETDPDTGKVYKNKVTSKNCTVAHLRVTFEGVKRDIAMLTHVCVALSFRKHGYGKTLLMEVEEALRKQGIKKIKLHSDPEDNTKGFYEKLGYVQVGQSTTDGYRMQKELVDVHLST